MIYEQRSSSIVMMTKLEERTRIKCDQYWPTRGTESYGQMHVTLMNVEELSTYCIRTFILQRTGYLDKREIRQFQFLGKIILGKTCFLFKSNFCSFQPSLSPRSSTAWVSKFVLINSNFLAFNRFSIA